MKKTTQNFLFLFALTAIFTNNIIAQTTSITVFDEVLYYDGYAGLLAEADLYEPMPPEVLRHSNSRYAVKLTDDQLNAMGNKLSMDITLKAACDNYDRIARVYLAFVDAGETTYISNDVERIEVSRFITPFMNKNNSPMEVPFTFTVDNVAEIFADMNLRADYDIWVELDVFGVPYAAQQQVAGCAGRIDTFYGTLVFNSETDPSQEFPEDNFMKTLACDENLNNYNGTDVPGETTKIIEFTLDETVDDLSLFLITSNHGANAGGEEYERRDHFLYLDDALVYEYIPGGKSCEPYRQYNTQGNGIYSGSPRSTRQWLSFSNWCPGDVIPNREIVLGTLTAGTHTIKLDVPDAVFVDDQGYIPVSMYLQNRKSFQDVCVDPTNLTASDETSSSVLLNWDENGDATEWEILYGYASSINNENFVTTQNLGETVEGLIDNRNYSFYVRSLCDSESSSNWVGPINKATILGVEDNVFSGFEFYPNPATDRLMIKSVLPIEQIELYDALGKLMMVKNSIGISSEINVSDISTGLYFMKVKIDGASKSYKLLVN